MLQFKYNTMCKACSVCMSVWGGGWGGQKMTLMSILDFCYKTVSVDTVWALPFTGKLLTNRA